MAKIAQMANVIVQMEKLAARLTMLKAMVAVLILTLFVAKTGFTVALMEKLLVILVVVLFLTLFAVNT